MDHLLLVTELRLHFPNEQLVFLMKSLKQLREQPPAENLIATCTISGFDKDPRGLGEIAEVRAFCRRLVKLGFISWLEPSTSIEELSNPAIQSYGGDLGLGAIEVWLIAEGLLKRGWTEVEAEVLERFVAVLKEANQKADSLCSG